MKTISVKKAVALSITLVIFIVLIYLGNMRFFLFGYYDCWAYFLPNAALLDNELSQGRFPLWNHLILGGTPFAANPQAAVFYPPNLFRAFFVGDAGPLWTLISLRVLVLAHVTLAFFLCRCFALRHGLSAWGAVIAACAYAFSIEMTAHAIGAWILVIVPAFLPGILLLMRRAAMSDGHRGRIAAVAGAGGLLGLGFLGGYPQHTLYTLVIMGLYALWLSHARGVGMRGWCICATRRQFPELAAVCVLGLLAGAAVWVPAMELAGYALRGGTGGVQVRYWRDATHSLPYILRPSLVGLAVLALPVIWKRELRIFAVLLALFLDFLLGGPAEHVLRALAPFKLGSPLRASAFLALPLGMLAGAGYDRLCAFPAGLPRHARMAAFCVFCMVAALGFAFSPFLLMPNSWLFKLASPILAGGALCAFFILAPRRALVFFALVVCVDIALWDSFCRHETGVKLRTFPYDTGWLEQARAVPVNKRSVDEHPNCPASVGGMLVNGYEPARLALADKLLCTSHDQYVSEITPSTGTLNLSSAYGLFKRPFWLVDSPGLDTVLKQWVMDPGGNAGILGVMMNKPTESIEVMGEKWRVVNEKQEERTFGFDSFLSKGTHTFVKITFNTFAPVSVRVFTRTPKFLVASADFPDQSMDAILQAPLPDNFSGLDVVFSGAGADGIVPAKAILLEDTADYDSLITVIEHNSRRTKVKVGPLDGEKRLLFTSFAYPGWKLSVDGISADIVPTAGVFQWITLSSGIHEVEFRMVSKSVNRGVLISLTGFVMCILGLVCGRPPWKRGA